MIQPVASLVSHIRLWSCDHCGIQRPLNKYTRQRKYCSTACHGLAMRGKANPAYAHGNRATNPNRRRFVRPSDHQIGQVRQWVAERRRLGSAADAAKRIGVSLRAMYLYSSESHWMGRVAP